MTDFTPLLKTPTAGFKGGVAEERVQEQDALAEVITPIRGLSGVEPVRLIDHSEKARQNLFSAHRAGEAPEPPPEAPPAPSGPTEEEILERIQKAEQAVEEHYQEKLAKLDLEVQQAVTALEAQAQALDDHRQELAAEARQQTGALVVAAIRKLCGTLPEALDALILDRVSAAAEALVGAAEVVLRVRPEDVQAAKDILGGREGWRVVADADLDGGCVAQSASGTVDGSLNATMAALDDAVGAWRAERGEGEGT